MSPEDAEEWCAYNIELAHLDEHAPIIFSMVF
jgi:hypothetical protein